MKLVGVDFYRLCKAFDILPSATIWVGYWNSLEGDDGATIWELEMSWLRWGVSVEWKRYIKKEKR